MGIKTKLTKQDISRHIKCKEIKATKHGVTDTVYILDNKYVLKLFEENTINTIKEELKLLKSLKKLNITKIVKKPFILKNKIAVIYKKCDGKSIKKVKNTHIKEIGEFLKNLHKKTKNKTSQNKTTFDTKNIKKKLQKAKHHKFDKIYNSINIKLKNDGIIHGDIFRDNTLFKNDKISCVIDFSEACNGDFYFDLAVVGLDWCKGDKELKILLQSYGAKISLKKFKNYIQYAGLYYILNRYLDGRDYKALAKRIKRL